MIFCLRPYIWKALASAAGLLLCIVAPAPVCAQIRIPDVLSSHFDAGSPYEASGGAGAMLRDQAVDECDDNDRVDFGSMSDSTLKSVKKGAGVVDDLNDQNSFVAIRTRLGSRSSAPVLSIRGSWLQGTVNSTDSKTTIVSSETLSTSDLSLHWRLRHGSSLDLLVDTSNYHLDGISNITNGVFNIFPTNPLMHLCSTSNRSGLQWMSSPSPPLQVSLLIGSQWTVGSLLLASPGSDARISIPVGNDGPLVCGASRLRVSSRCALTGFLETSNQSGDGTVSRELGAAIGSSNTMHDSEAEGLSVAIKESKQQTLQLFYEHSVDNWSVNGTVDSAADIGVPITYATGLGFNASYNIQEEIAGVNWTKSFSQRKSLDVEYRWIELDGREKYGYQASVFLLPFGNSGEQEQNDFRGHLLRVKYDIPIGRAVLGLDAGQIIPVGGTSRVAAGGAPVGSTHGGSESTTGGWSLGVDMSYPI